MRFAVSFTFLMLTLLLCLGSCAADDQSAVNNELTGGQKTFDLTRDLDGQYLKVTVRSLEKALPDGAVSVCVSSLNDYFKDERNGRLIDICKLGEYNYNGFFGSRVSGDSIVGALVDVKYNPDEISDNLSVEIAISDSFVDYSYYDVYRVQYYEKGTDDEWFDLNRTTFSYDSNGREICSDIEADDKSGLATFAVVDVRKLEEFHRKVNDLTPEQFNERNRVVTRKFLHEYEYEFISPPDYSSYSDTYDTDGDGLSDRQEMLLGFDPENPETYGVPDGEKARFQKYSEEQLRDINEADGRCNLYIECVSSEDISSTVTAAVDELMGNQLRSENNGRRVTVHDGGEDIEGYFGGVVNYDSVSGPVVEININEKIKESDQVNVAFEIPGASSAENYDIGCLSFNGVVPCIELLSDYTFRYGNKVAVNMGGGQYFLVLVDRKKAEEFAKEHNGRTLEEEAKCRMYSRDILSLLDYEFWEQQ